MQLKNPKKHDEFGAGKWDMGAAGHNCYVKENGSYRPMDFKETLIKEVDEEIGLDIDVIDSVDEFVKILKTKIKDKQIIQLTNLILKNFEKNKGNKRSLR